MSVLAVQRGVGWEVLGEWRGALPTTAHMVVATLQQQQRVGAVGKAGGRGRDRGNR